MRSLAPLCALWLLPLCLFTLSPQTLARAPQDLDDVTFSGTVRDEHGALLPGATVSAVPVATRAARSVTTDGEGRYRLVELAPGAYTLRAAAAGFADEERRDIQTTAGQHVRLDFALRAAGPEGEALTVRASEVPPLDTTRGVAGGAVARQESERLPSRSRSALDFVFTLGGVSEEPLGELYSQILYLYETDASVYAGSGYVHTENLYVHGRQNTSPAHRRPSLPYREVKLEVVSPPIAADWPVGPRRVPVRARDGV